VQEKSRCGVVGRLDETVGDLGGLLVVGLGGEGRSSWKLSCRPGLAGGTV